MQELTGVGATLVVASFVFTGCAALSDLSFLPIVEKSTPMGENWRYCLQAQIRVHTYKLSALSCLIYQN